MEVVRHRIFSLVTVKRRSLRAFLKFVLAILAIPILAKASKDLRARLIQRVILAYIKLVFEDTTTRWWHTLICSTGSIACQWSKLACFVEIDRRQDRILLNSLKLRFTFCEFIFIEHRLSLSYSRSDHSFTGIVVLGTTITSRILRLLSKENSLLNIRNRFKVEAKSLFGIDKSFIMVMFAQSFDR